MSKRKRNAMRIAAPPVMPGPAFATAAKILRQTESMFRQRMIRDRVPDGSDAAEWRMCEENADGCDLAVREIVTFVQAYEQWLALVLPVCSLAGRGQMRKAPVPLKAEDPDGKGLVRPMAYVMEPMFYQAGDERIEIPPGIYYSDGRITPLTTGKEEPHGEGEEGEEGEGVECDEDPARPDPEGGAAVPGGGPPADEAGDSPPA